MSSEMGEYFSTDHLRSDLKKKALRGAGATVFSQVSVYCIQMIGTIILARLLTPADFGLIAMVTAFSLLLRNCGLRGFTEATIQAEVIDHKKISTLFWINLVLSLALTLFFIALAPLLAWFYDEPRLKSITVAIALSFVFTALSTQHLALLARNMQFYRITVNEVVATIVGVVAAIIMATQGYGYWALVVRRVVPFIAIAGGAWILCRWVPSLPARGTGVKPMLKFGMNTYGNFASNYVSRNLDKVLIGWRHGAQSLGFYERAYYLFVMPVNQLSYPLTNVAVSALSKLRDDPEKYRDYYLKALSMIAFVGMPLSATLTLIGKDFLLLLLGPQWYKAGEIFTVFGPGVGILLVYGTHGWLHLSLGRADRWFRWGIVELIGTTFCFTVALPFGAIGVAFAYTASFYLLVLPGLLYAGKPVNLSLSSVLSATWKYYASALSSGFLCWFLLYSHDSTSQIFIQFNIWIRIIVSSLLSFVFYLFVLFLLYHNLVPLKQFLSTTKNMLPTVFQKKKVPHT